MYAALRIPGFPLAAVLRDLPDPPPAPRCVATGHERTSVLKEVDAAGRAMGIVPGMSTTRGLARCPNLSVLVRSPSSEKRADDLLFSLALSLSPRVERTAPGTALIDVRGRKKEPPEEWGRSVLRKGDAAGLLLDIGISDTPDRALWVVSLGERFSVACGQSDLLKGITPDRAPIPPELCSVFQDWGICDLHRLLDFSREMVLRRTGPEGKIFWDTVVEGKERVLHVESPGIRYESLQELEVGIETLEQALFLLRRQVEEIACGLEFSGKVAGRLHLHLKMESGQVYRHTFPVPDPTARVEMLFRMIAGHLESVRTDSPLVGFYLRAEPANPVSRQMDWLVAGIRNPARFTETLGRIAALVGDGNAGTPERADTHRPDAFQLGPVPNELGPGAILRESEGRWGPALRRFRPPPPVAVRREKGKPVECRGKDLQGMIRAARGPWLSSGTWWEGSLRWSLEEWDVEMEAGGIYRLGRPRRGEWRVEGVYD